MGKEFNALNNTTVGEPKKTFYMNEGSTKKENKIVTPSTTITDAMGIPLTSPSMKHGKAELDPLTLKNEIKEYNANLKNIPVEAKSFVMNGNMLVVRLYKHDPFVMSESDPTQMIFYNPIQIPYKDPTDEGRIKGMEAPLQFLNRGVIVNMSGHYSDFFSKNFKVGDVVDIKIGAALMLARFWINPEQFVRQEFDNYFSFNENMIEKKVFEL